MQVCTVVSDNSQQGDVMFANQRSQKQKPAKSSGNKKHNQVPLSLT
ncbi:hypothetical protein L911_2324 [Vibrio fluvialis I21563]|nr:hypothetical protein L911_2324 [Vibrio fluvialis I21563]